MPRRKIMFYRVEIGVQEAQELRVVSSQQEIEFVVSNAINFLNQLEFNYEEFNSRYHRMGNGNDIFIMIDSNVAGVVEGRLITSRRGALPSIESSGNLTELPLRDEEGLAEITHFIYFYRQKILGMEFNFYGPKSSNLTQYLQAKLPGVIDMFRITPVISNEISQLLENDNFRLTMLNISACRNGVEIVRQLNDSLGSAFEAAANASEAEEIEITLKRRSRSRDTFGSRGFCFRNFMENAFFHREEFSKLKVGYIQNEENKIIDLLNEKLCVQKDVELQNDRYRTLNSFSVYNAIREAFEELGEELIIRV